MPKKKKQQRTRKKAVKKMTPKRKVARRRPAAKRSLARKKVKFSAKRKRVASTGLVVETVPLKSVERREHHRQAGDLQALSSRPTANSESVGELLKEGNALEAEAIQGVENALDANQGEVETHEVLEDDVPQEYLDKDR